MQSPRKSHRRFWIGRLPQHCASEHSADVYIPFHVARCACELAAIPECANNHPRYLVTCAQAPEHFKRCRRIFAFPDTPSVAFILIADALSDPPQAVMACGKAMQLVFVSFRFPLAVRNGRDRPPDIIWVTKNVFDQTMAIPPCHFRRYLVIEQTAWAQQNIVSPDGLVMLSGCR